MENGWIVYILKCADGTLYTGMTNDMEHRISMHNAGKGAKYTKARRPVSIVYTEKAATKSDALKRESSIKKLKRAAKLDMISKYNEKTGAVVAECAK